MILLLQATTNELRAEFSRLKTQNFLQSEAIERQNIISEENGLRQDLLLLATNFASTIKVVELKQQLVDEKRAYDNLQARHLQLQQEHNGLQVHFGQINQFSYFAGACAYNSQNAARQMANGHFEQTQRAQGEICNLRSQIGYMQNYISYLHGQFYPRSFNNQLPPPQQQFVRNNQPMDWQNVMGSQLQGTLPQYNQFPLMITNSSSNQNDNRVPTSQAFSRDSLADFSEGLPYFPVENEDKPSQAPIGPNEEIKPGGWSPL